MRREKTGHEHGADMLPHNLAQQLQQARMKKGISQNQLAALIHVSRQTISNWENARSQPDYQTLQRLAALLELNLVFGVPVPKPAQTTSRRRRRRLGKRKRHIRLLIPGRSRVLIFVVSPRHRNRF